MADEESACVSNDGECSHLVFGGATFDIWKDGDTIALRETYESTLEKLFPEKTWIYEKEEEDYQGEWFAVGFDESGYYFHQGSFGSCEGCDMLMGIESESDAIEFFTIMNRLTPIGRSLDEAISYLNKTQEGMWITAANAIGRIISRLKEMF